MCVMCDVTKTFDPARHVPGTTDSPLFAPDGAQRANYSEVADAADNVGTVYSIGIGDYFSGSVDFLGDIDWVAVTLEAGQTYRFDLTGGSLPDPYLVLYDANGSYITENDDGGVSGLDASIRYTATATGTYYIAAEGWDYYDTGSYTLSLSSTDPAPVGTLDEMADFLTDGYWADEGGARSFDTRFSNEITVNLSALTADGQQLARWALGLWEMVADLEFSETSGSADITFDDNESGAFANSSYIGGDIQWSTVNISTEWLATYGTEIDSSSFSTYVHEIGHALGLGHQGDYNVFANYGSDEAFANDSWQLSVMSYFSQTENTTVNASFAEPIGAMMVDILAIQNLYGAPGSSSATAGDTTWGGPNTTFGNALDEVFDHLETGSNPNLAGNPIALTIYDLNGTDLLDASGSTTHDRIDLTPESFSDISGLIGNVGIARGTIIENLNTGSGNDTVTGNDVANTIDTGAGNDIVDGGAGSDSIDGGVGFDTINGGIGADTLNGNAHADLINGGMGNDLIDGGDGFDVLYGDEGNDTIDGGATPDRLYGGDGDDRLLAGSNFSQTVDGLWGEAGNDTLFGEGGFDYLDGGEGDDYLDGGHQADNLYGRTGNDTMYGDLGLDRLFGGAGNDEAHGGAGNDGLFGEQGNDTLNGDAGNDRFFGGSGNDLINGGADSDTVYGGAGFDTIDGGTGNDLLQGDFNADRFVFFDGHGNDTITDFDALNDFEVIDFGNVGTINNINDLLAPGGAASQVSADVVIDTGGGNSITLLGVTLGDLDSNDFAF